MGTVGHRLRALLSRPKTFVPANGFRNRKSCRSVGSGVRRGARGDAEKGRSPAEAQRRRGAHRLAWGETMSWEKEVGEWSDERGFVGDGS